MPKVLRSKTGIDVRFYALLCKYRSRFHDTFLFFFIIEEILGSPSFLNPPFELLMLCFWTAFSQKAVLEHHS